MYVIDFWGQKFILACFLYFIANLVSKNVRGFVLLNGEGLFP